MADEPLSRVEEILEGGSPPLLSRIEKLLQEGGAGGGASPEQIAAAVEAYLDEHGVTVTETDPTVPEWAKAAQKPTYTASEVGALPSDTVIPAEVTDQTVSGWGYTKNTGDYTKPSGGIPKIDLSDDVQTSLGKADTALQTHQDISGKLDKAQGAANAGKFMVVGSNGDITAVTMQAWSGGSY